MEGGRGEVGYEIVVESAIEICILSRILSCWPTCSKGWQQTMHCRPIADTLVVLHIEMLDEGSSGGSVTPLSLRNLPQIEEIMSFWRIGNFFFFSVYIPTI